MGPFVTAFTPSCFSLRSSSSVPQQYILLRSVALHSLSTKSPFQYFVTMSYTIHVRVIQTKPTNWFSIVEKTCWHYGNGAYWSEVDGDHILQMGASGTSGMLRFRGPSGGYFLVALGVHNYKRWCDIVPDHQASNTGVQIHPTYYDDKDGRNQMLWKQLAHLERTSTTGIKLTVDYYKEDGNTLYATITIE
jgi:hypothetical protein